MRGRRLIRWLSGAALVIAAISVGIYYTLFQTLPFMPRPDLTGEILSQTHAGAVKEARRIAVKPRTLVYVQAGRASTANAAPRERLSTTDPARAPLRNVEPLNRRSGALATLQPITGAEPPAVDTAGASSAPSDSTSQMPRHGQMISGSLPSALLGGSRPLFVYLPAGYDTGQQRYPVLYLLHGAPGNYKDWYHAAGIDKTLDALISVGRIPPLIAVLPDGNGGYFGDSEWANSADGSIRAEDYLVGEVVPYIDNTYRTRADRAFRAIGGLSTGGFGAVNITLHHPDVFGYALSLSGNYLAARTWTGKDLWAGHPAAKAFNSPTLYAPSAKGIGSTYFYLCVGASDNEDNTLQQTRQFAGVLDRLKIPHTMQYFPGSHSWRFWRTHIVDALDALAQVMPT
jgi:enterochelin esterase-like enzyme